MEWRTTNYREINPNLVAARVDITSHVVALASAPPESLRRFRRAGGRFCRAGLKAGALTG